MRFVFIFSALILSSCSTGALTYSEAEKQRVREDKILQRAVTEMSCPREQLRIQELSNVKSHAIYDYKKYIFSVQGCGRRMSYSLACGYYQDNAAQVAGTFLTLGLVNPTSYLCKNASMSFNPNEGGS